MPYIFPKRYLRSRDVLDPEDLNDDFSPAQELVDGHLDRMNLDAASFKSDVTVATGAYFTPYYEAVEQDVSFGSDGGAANVATPNFVYVDGTTFRGHWPKDEGTKIYLVPNSGSWEAIGNGSGGAFSITATTGSSVLWITAYVQYVWQGFFELNEAQESTTVDGAEVDIYSTSMWPTDDSKWSYPSFEGSASFERKYPNQGGWHHRSRGARAAKIQFAVRIDGRVITSTITGRDELNEGSPAGMKAGFDKTRTKGQRSLDANASYDESEAIPGQRIPIAPTPGLGPEVMPVRFGAAVPVAPGEHTIEIVARRLPNTTRGIPRSRGDFVGVFTRRLLCLDLPNMPPHSDGRPDIKTIPDFDTEHVLDSASLHDQTAKRLRTRLNNIKRNDVFRHSIPNTHLPSKVQYVKRVSIQPPTETRGEGEEKWSLGRCNARWPGWPGGTTTGSSGDRNSADHVVTRRVAGWDQPFRDTDNGAGWYQLRRNSSEAIGVGNSLLEIDESASGDLNVTDDDILIVQADVFLRGINPIQSQFIAERDRSNPDDWRDYLNFHQIHKYLDYFAAFSIGYYSDGEWTIASDKRPGWVNHFNWFGRDPWYQSRRSNMTVKYTEELGYLTHAEVEDLDLDALPTMEGMIDGRGDHTAGLKQYCNIPLFWVIKGQNLNISKLGVFCCSTTPAANHTPGPTIYEKAPRNAISKLQIRWGNSSLMAMKLKK